jgi:hypothetical protein
MFYVLHRRLRFSKTRRTLFKTILNLGLMVFHLKKLMIIKKVGLIHNHH